jgi:hypothetical protein
VPATERGAVKPRKVPRQERAKQTVEAILGAAKRLLAERSFEHTTTNQVARVAGVSIGSLYQSMETPAIANLAGFALKFAIRMSRSSAV